MKPSSAMIRSKGFALIELLMVVSIIAFLAGLLIVGANLVRGQAHQIQCLNNLRQLSMGMHAYASDNKGRIPCPQVPAPDRDTFNMPYWGMWYGFILPYLSKSNAGAPLYWCPAGSFSLDETRAMGEFNAATASYGVNTPDVLSSDYNPKMTWWKQMLAVVPNPDQTVMLADHWGANNSGSAVSDIYGAVDGIPKGTPVSGPRRPGLGSYLVRASHSNNHSTDPSKGRVGVSFFSGRAQALRWQDSYNPANIWNAPNQWMGKY